MAINRTKGTRIGRTVRVLALLGAAGLLGAGATAEPPQQSAATALRIDADAVMRARFGNDAPWYRDNIPLFESSDPKLDAVYYYRWQLFRAHQRDLGEKGYISTEFMDDVGWQREPYASLNDATGFHLYEGRWLRDRRYAGDYIDFLYQDGGNDRHFSEAIADATYARFLVDGDRADAVRHLSAMRHIYGLWDDKFDFTKGLYFIEPLLDATEYTISSIDASGGKDGFRGGDSFRPSINAYMFANARAIARLSALSGDAKTAADYDARADRLRTRVEEALWSPKLGHFIDRYKVSNEHVNYWEPIRGRELAGYVPWTFGLPSNDPRFATAWKHLLSPQGLGGPFGMRTVEPSYPHYMQQYRYEGTAPECQWNGPIWPFQTTQTLTAMANLLRDYRQDVVTRADYLRLLRQYAQLHYQGDRLDLEEDYHPDTGKPIVGLARSHHYFHSGFTDLVIAGLVGLRPREDDVLEVDPLVPAGSGPDTLQWFQLQDVPYHGRLVTIRYDADGSHYHQGAGLRVLVDGQEVARTAKAERIEVPIARRAAPARATRIDRAVELVRGQFPKPSASSGTPERIHDAVDGRVVFFPENDHGWSSQAGERAPWLQVDFGKATELSSAELAFFADAQHAAPTGYTIEAQVDGRWQKVTAEQDAPLANGITNARWKPLRATAVRVRMRPQAGKPVRVVELKLF